MKQESFAAMTMTALMLSVSSPASGQQSFPSKPVRMIVPLAAGGPVDTVARIIGPRLAENLGQQVVIDNRPGAGGSVGGEMVARSVPDGHNILLAANGTIAISPHLLKLPYDATKDLTPISLVGTSPQALLVHPSLPTRSVKELIALARSRPGVINFASSGNGSTSHLASELFKMTTKIDIIHIPYKGAGPAMIDMMAGQTQMIITGVSSALPHIRSGKLRVLGVTSTKRISVLPDIPAIAESVPGYEVTTWYALFAPAGTPAAVVARINQDLVKAVNHSETKANLVGAGVEAETNTPEQMGAMGRDEFTKWGKLVQALGIGRK